MKMIKQGFVGVLAAFAVSAVTPALIPFSRDGDGNLNVVGYLAGVMFWMGLLVGCIGYYLLVREAKKGEFGGAEKRKWPSAAYFFSNRPALVTDIVLIAALAGTIYCAVNVTVNQIVAVGFLLLALAGIYAHFLLNGNVYQYIWNTREQHRQDDKEQQLEHGRNEENE